MNHDIVDECIYFNSELLLMEEIRLYVLNIFIAHFIRSKNGLNT
jgi:hypothetical protein